MKYFKDSLNRVFAFEADGSQDAFILPGLTLIDTEEVERLRQLPPAVPTSVTMRQARLALLATGALAGVDAFIDALPSPQKEAARIEWEFAATVDRSSDLVVALAAALDLDAAALDALFTQAGAL